MPTVSCILPSLGSTFASPPLPFLLILLLLSQLLPAFARSPGFRDLTKIDEITSDKITGSLDATMNIDNRVFTGAGWASIASDVTNFGTNLIAAAEGAGKGAVHSLGVVGDVLASIGETFTGTAGLDPTNLPKVINDKVSFQQVVAELPKTCPDCTDWLNGKNFDPDEPAKIQETIAETARIHGLTLNEFLIIADKNGLYGLHNGNDGGTVAVNALKPDGSGFSSGQDRVFTFGHESPGHSSGGNSEEYADLMGSYALGAMNLSNWLNGRERLTDSSLSATDWLAAHGDSDFVRYNNAWGNFLAEQKDTHKREDGYDRHALGQKTYEELVATDIAMDERYKDDWGHVTGPMLAMGHAGKGLFEFGGLWLQWGVSVLSSGEYYPDAPKQLSYTILSIPENLSNGFAQALQDFSSGDRHRIWYGATNLAMIFSPYVAGKVGETGIVVGGGAGGFLLTGCFGRRYSNLSARFGRDFLQRIRQ